MPIKYNQVFGWMNYQQLYLDVVDRFDNCTFAELGSFKGKSALFMAEAIKEANKNINLLCVDLWPSPEECKKFTEFGAGQGEEEKIIGKSGVSLMQEFIDNTSEYRDTIFPLRNFTTYTADLFPDKHFKFIFVDAGHSKEQVMNDLKVWYPKLDDDGVIAGHDYDDPQVRAGVDEFFGKDKVLGGPNQWILK